MYTLRCVCPSPSAHPKGHALCICVRAHGRYKDEGGECRAVVLCTDKRDVHMMCVGSVRAVVGSSAIPIGRASKCSFKKDSASITLEAVLTHFKTKRGSYSGRESSAAVMTNFVLI